MAFSTELGVGDAAPEASGLCTDVVTMVWVGLLSALMMLQWLDSFRAESLRSKLRAVVGGEIGQTDRTCCFLAPSHHVETLFVRVRKANWV